MTKLSALQLASRLRSFPRVLKNLISRVHDVYALALLGPLLEPYIPWTRSALRPAALAAVLNEVVIHERRTIVECGSGVSTIMLARLIDRKRLDAHVYSIEHDPQWAGLVQKMVRAENLDEFVTIIVAPLSQYGERQWYDQEVLEESFPDQTFDLLIVDGPPGGHDSDSNPRYQAMPFFQSRLNDDFAVVLDDIDRPGEQAILRQWQHLLGGEFKEYVHRGNIAIFHSRNAANIQI